MEQLITIASGFGGPGLLIGFMVWQQNARSAVDEKRIAADLEMAKAMMSQAERFSVITQILNERLK